MSGLFHAALGGLAMAAMMLNLACAAGEHYPRSLPTWLAVPICGFAGWQLLGWAVPG